MRRSIAILVGVAFVVAAFSDRALSQGTPEGKEDLALHDLDAVAALQKNNPILLQSWLRSFCEAAIRPRRRRLKP
jgi:hypothetical protein